MRYEIEKLIQIETYGNRARASISFNTLDRDQDGKVSINELF